MYERSLPLSKLTTTRTSSSSIRTMELHLWMHLTTMQRRLNPLKMCFLRQRRSGNSVLTYNRSILLVPNPKTSSKRAFTKCTDLSRNGLDFRMHFLRAGLNQRNPTRFPSTFRWRWLIPPFPLRIQTTLCYERQPTIDLNFLRL